MCWIPDRAVWVRAVAGNFERRSSLLSQVYDFVSANLILGGSPEMDWHLIQWGVEILLVASCYGNWNELCHYGPLAQLRLYFLPLLLKHRVRFNNYNQELNTFTFYKCH